VEEADAAWRNDLDLVDVPAREALSAALAPLGLTLAADPKLAQSLDRPIRLTRRDCSPLASIEEVCRAIGAYPDYSQMEAQDGGALVGMMAMMFCGSAEGASEPAPEKAAHRVLLHPGRRPMPVAFAGPIAVEVAQLQEHAPYATGNLELRVHVAGLPAAVMACGEMHGYLELELDVTDQTGRSVGNRLVMARPWYELPGIHSRSHWLSLTGLLRPVETLHVRGRARVAVPVEVHTLRIPQLAPDLVRSAGSCELTVLGLKRGAPTGEKDENGEPEQTYELHIEVRTKSSAPFRADEQIIVFDERGRAMKFGDRSLSRDPYGSPPDHGELIRGELSITGKPASLVMKVIERVETLEYPFELQIPLRRAAEQPEQLEPLSFPGAAPISIEALKLTRDEPFSQVAIRVTNQSNKDVKNCSCVLTYFDSAGHKLSAEPGIFAARATLAPEPIPAVAKGETKDNQLTAFHLPQNAARVTVAPRAVTFMDDSQWPAAPR
jgi:hypothetical protein